MGLRLQTGINKKHFAQISGLNFDDFGVKIQLFGLNLLCFWANSGQRREPMRQF